MKDIEHILRVVAIFFVAITVFLIARAKFKPPSFGKIGHYRAAAVDEIKALPTRYAGQKECGKCHKQQVQEKAANSHKTMSCESCHGALADHVRDHAKHKPARPSDKEMREFCGHCHSKAISRPKAFPQINIYEHNPGVSCQQCHNPHKPKL